MKKLFHLLPLLSGLLYSASHPPIDLGFLGWVALVPLTVHAMKDTCTWRPFLLSWAGGYLSYFICMWWMHYNVMAAPFALPVYLAVYWGLYAWLIRRFTRKFTVLCVAAPVVWVAGEWVRGFLFGGMGLLKIGYSQYPMLNLIQIVDLGGPWLLSALVVLVNVVMARAFLTKEDNAWKDREFRVGALTAVSLILLSTIYGVIRVATLEVRDGPEIAVIQPNVPQHIKLLMREPSVKRKEAMKIYEKHRRMTKDVIGEEPPDLVIWPESVLYRGICWDPEKKRWYEGYDWYRSFIKAARAAGTLLLTGTELREFPGGVPTKENLKIYNSAVLVDPTEGIVGRYNKVVLVPFAEYFYTRELPLIKKIAFWYIGDSFLEFTPGDGFPLFEAGGTAFGVSICFEVLFPEISREIAGKGGKFAVNISNEGWFRSSAELDQMHVLGRFRAIESRIAFVRATNTGISSFYAPTGELDEVLEVDGRSKEVEGVIRRRVRITDNGSLYRNVGNVVAWLFAGAVFSALLLSWLPRRIQKA